MRFSKDVTIILFAACITSIAGCGSDLPEGVDEACETAFELAVEISSLNEDAKDPENIAKAKELTPKYKKAVRQMRIAVDAMERDKKVSVDEKKAFHEKWRQKYQDAGLEHGARF